MVKSYWVSASRITKVVSSETSCPDNLLKLLEDLLSFQEMNRFALEATLVIKHPAL
jgi:hypothetical protein